MMMLSSSVACSANAFPNSRISLGSWRNASGFSLHQPFQASALNPLQSCKVPAGTCPLVITAKRNFQIAAATTTPRVITVAQDGTGDFCTVQEAIYDVPLRNTQRIVIKLAPGRYREPVFVRKTKDKITLSGSSPENTIITFDNTENKLDQFMECDDTEKRAHQSTYWCGTVIVEAEDFIAENITFENSDAKRVCPAVALRMSGDRGALYNCRILGYQDTLYLHSQKQYVKDSYIEGSVDFICGTSTALLEHCHIHCKSDGWVTAHSRELSDDSSGFVFLRCMITGDRKEKPYVYLGRPWRAHGRVVFAYTYMDECITSEGWQDWTQDSEFWRTACFYEYRCFGPGSSPTGRVDWAKQPTEEEAAYFLDHSFVDPDPKKRWLLQSLDTRIPRSIMMLPLTEGI